MKVPEPDQTKIKLNVGKLVQNMTRQLNNFVVTNCYLEAGAHSIYLFIDLRRLSAPFWMSLFIPTICLVLAAEIALFIDESHFETMIMVALTSNLVMYTLHSTIQEKLPDDSSMKLIDMWLVHGLVMPMVVFVVLSINRIMCSQATDKTTKANSSARNSTKEEQSTRKIFMKMCKVVIPTTSALFIIAFSIVCIN